MPEKKEVVTSAGFLEIMIEVEKTVTSASLAYVSTIVYLYSPSTKSSERIPVRIDSSQTIVLKPGKYIVTAYLGSLSSKEIPIEVKEGQIERLVFHFGKTRA